MSAPVILRCLVLLLPLGLGGCITSAPDLSRLNPFAERQERLPGTRRPIIDPSRTTLPKPGQQAAAAEPAPAEPAARPAAKRTAR